ncbi:flagellar hook assembly protein FlgD [Geobacter sp. SVR]|uniref:flagellar hook assembly protein FlgD n=1 Tax=Geobacter sp. SVR TaxID=2495594 RepID=UPI001AFC2F3A|nr:basal-body rod modification protein FlgD [Geobacter sp. SVR]
MINVVDSVTSTTDASAAAAAMKKSIGMDKDDFLKLFIAQLQYQDPLQPQDPSAMLNQLSQLSMLEQSYNSNTTLQSLLTAQNNANSINAVSFVGGNLKANGDAVAFDGTSAASLQFNLPVATSSAVVSIKDSAGNTVRTATLDASAAGDASYSWDGRDNNGNLLPAGTYHFAVNGTAANGTAVAATTYTTGIVDGVSFANGTPMLTVGGISVALSDVISVKGA